MHYSPKNVSRGEANNIGKLLGCTITKDLGNYLRMSLIHSRVSNQTCHKIIEKVEKHLSGWVAFHLSLAGRIAGRITLAQSVLQAIPVYAMQTTNLPLEVRTKIDRDCKNFIWSESFISQKISLIKWQTVCQPKYGIPLSNLPSVLPIGYGFHLWKAIGKVWTETLMGIRWSIGKGGPIFGGIAGQPMSNLCISMSFLQFLRIF
ncbi:hypothetical protein KPL70_021892 [Citrus sinensis]|nr:hypothetical protein KPL70_021892 [Citrus sinensis]